MAEYRRHRSRSRSPGYKRSRPGSQYGEQDEAYYAKLREERERVAVMGVPEVWALSPPRPTIE